MPLRADASVSKPVITLMATDPATDASPWPPAAAAPQTMKSSVLEAGVIAAIVIPFPVITEPLSAYALLEPSTTFRLTPTPTRVPPLSMSTAVPIAFAVASTSA